MAQKVIKKVIKKVMLVDDLEETAESLEPATLPVIKHLNRDTIYTRASEALAALKSGYTTTYNGKPHIHFSESTAQVILRCLEEIQNEVK